MGDTRELFQIFVRRFGILNAVCCDACCGQDVSLVQSHILYEIKRQNSGSMQQVAEALGMDITTFSRQIKTLVTKGLVIKSPSPEDGRVTLLLLSPEGEKLEGLIDDRMKDFLARIFSHFTDKEKEMVEESIQILNEAILDSGSCCNP